MDVVEPSQAYAEMLAAVQERRRALAAACAEAFPEPCAITFEAGCGHGHFMAAYAEAHPGERCLGVDLVTKRIERCNRKKENRGLANALFLKAELFELLEALPAHVRFGRVLMLFPDPWPKKRHHRRRMLNHTFLNAIADKMSPDGDFCFRTDHAELYEWAVEHVQENERWEIDPSAAWPFEHTSFFQNLMDGWHSFIAKPVTY